VKTITLELRDVTDDGFPSDGAVAFLWDGDIYTGWPLIDRDNSYPGNRAFATPEQARNNPLNVEWEASEDRVLGRFVGVQFWFPLDELRASTSQEKTSNG
jgi:hypothetical protein